MLLAMTLLLTGVYVEAEAKVRGRVVDLKIRLVNEGAPFYLHFPSVQMYDLELQPGGLRWSDDRVFSSALARRAIGSGVWDLRERWVLPPVIEPGEYKLRVWFTHRGGPPLETTIPIAIPPPR